MHWAVCCVQCACLQCAVCIGLCAVCCAHVCSVLCAVYMCAVWCVVGTCVLLPSNTIPYPGWLLHSHHHLYLSALSQTFQGVQTAILTPWTSAERERERHQPCELTHTCGCLVLTPIWTCVHPSLPLSISSVLCPGHGTPPMCTRVSKDGQPTAVEQMLGTRRNLH